MTSRTAHRSKALGIAAIVAGLVVGGVVLGSSADVAQAHHNPGHGSGGGGSTPTATPPPAPLDGGTIYFRANHLDGSNAHELRRIAPDGTGNAAVAGITSGGGTRPSRRLHHGERWHVTLREPDGVVGFFPGGPSGGRLWELDLVRESDLLRVPLTDLAGACIQIWGGEPGIRYDWTYDATGQKDGAIGWLGARWEDLDADGTCDQVAEGGVFRGAVSIDASGNVSFAQPAAPEVDVALSGTSTRAAEFTWAPDGQRMAYVDSSGSDLWVVDALGNRQMIFNGRVFDVAWSPDLDPGTAGLQTKIAFTGAVSGRNGQDSERGTYTINPDGTGRLRLASAPLQKKSSDPFVVHFEAHWSPVGTHLIYTERETSQSSPITIVEEVHRVTAGGTGDVVLVGTVAYRPVGLGWTVD